MSAVVTSAAEVRARRLTRDRQIAELNRLGMSDRKIAASMGVALNVVRDALARPARELRDVAG